MLSPPLSPFSVHCLFPVLFPASRLQISALVSSVWLLFTSVFVGDLNLVWFHDSKCRVF